MLSPAAPSKMRGEILERLRRHELAQTTTNESNACRNAARSVKEFIQFGLRTIAKRIGEGSHCIENAGKHMHVVANSAGLVCIAVTDKSYKPRIAISMLRALSADVVAEFP